MKTEKIPDIYLEQYLLGELPVSLRDEIETRLSNDTGLARRVEGLKSSNSAILEQYPPKLMVVNIQRDAERCSLKNMKYQQAATGSKKDHAGAKFINSLQSIVQKLKVFSSKRIALAVTSSAFAVITLVLIMPWITGTDDLTKSQGGDTRIKGLDSKLVLYRVKGKQAEELKDLSSAAEGDIIQAGYIATGNYRYGVIISIDGRGTVTTHFPGPDGHQQLVLNKKTMLDKSYELDNSPRFERFIMVLSESQIDISTVIKNAKKLALNAEKAETGKVRVSDDSFEYSVMIKKRPASGVKYHE